MGARIKGWGDGWVGKVLHKHAGKVGIPRVGTAAWVCNPALCGVGNRRVAGAQSVKLELQAPLYPCLWASLPSSSPTGTLVSGWDTPQTIMISHGDSQLCLQRSHFPPDAHILWFQEWWCLTHCRGEMAGWERWDVPVFRIGLLSSNFLS